MARLTEWLSTKVATTSNRSNNSNNPTFDSSRLAARGSICIMWCAKLALLFASLLSLFLDGRERGVYVVVIEVIASDSIVIVVAGFLLGKIDSTLVGRLPL